MIETIYIRNRKAEYRELIDEVDVLEDEERFDEALEVWKEIVEVLNTLEQEGCDVGTAKRDAEQRVNQLESIMVEGESLEVSHVEDPETREDQDSDLDEDTETDDDERVPGSEDRDGESSDTGGKQGSEDTEFEFMTPEISFDDVGGMEKVKKQVGNRSLAGFEDPDGFEEYGLTPPNGILFYGPPGTGKTFFSKAIAGEVDGGYLEVKGGDIKNRYVGESEKNMIQVFEEAAENSPCVVVIDEVDKLASDRRMPDNSKVSRDLTNEFLAVIQDLPPDVLAVGTTNHRSMIDDAMLRPGRFTQQFEIGLPDAGTRLEVLKVRLRDRPVVESEVDLRTIANSTEGYTCADLEELVNRAALAAYHNDEDIVQKHLIYALNKVSPSSKDW